MKSKILYFLLAIPALVLAQSTNQNYVKSTTYKQATTTPIATPDVTVANVQVSYFDGLGRPIQQVAHKQSNSGKDIITHIEYDQFGRQTKEFLPFPNSSPSMNYNDPSAVNSEMSTFYNNYNGGTTNPFSEKQLENSPLNRVFKQAAPGNPWAMGSGKEIKFDYQTNGFEEVKYFKVNASWDSSKGLYEPAIVQTGYYAENELYKTITKDENWKAADGKNNTTEEFKDKEGKVVLKRTYNNGDKHDTYYIYDQYGNLTYVIPPLAEGVASEDNLNYLGYQYKYDNRNRLVEKKLPGKQWEFIVYNSQDLPVATGPAKNPFGEDSNGWLITKYDSFGRVIYTGWYYGRPVSQTDRKLYQDEQNINSSFFEVVNNFFYNGIDLRYSNKVRPIRDYYLLTINYYDNYLNPTAPSTLPTPIENQTLATNVKGMSTGSWVKVLDNATSTTAEVSYTLYDNKYRPIHTKTTNYLGGYTQVDTHLDWAGKTLYTLTKHKRTNANTELVVKDMFEYTDQDRLAVHKQQITSSPNMPEQLIAKNTYDELGQLISKNVGGEDATGGTSLQTVDYSYNIRGWLKTINDVNTIGNDLFAFKINYNDAESATPLYNGNISETFWNSSADNIMRKYDYTYDNLNRLLKADYSKDGNTSFNSYLEQLTYDKNGNIKSLLRNGNMDTDGLQFENPIDHLTYMYDTDNKNQLLRVFDATANPQGFKDDTDGTNINLDISEAPDYRYDENGNMLEDKNKGITSILYNHLNLPTKIVFNDSEATKITYLYNATGQKVRKIVDIGGNKTNTEYLSGFQYKNGALQFFPHAEGYVNATENVTIGGGTSYTFNYVFNFTDHLGNIRLSYSKDPATNVLKIIEENHYYPFGLKHTGYNSDRMIYSRENQILKIRPVPPLFVTSYKYKFENKEWQDELSLNLYDFGGRLYDPATVRTTTHDPLAEKFYSISPQSFLNNNPMYFVDPTGMASDGWIKQVADGVTTMSYDANVNTVAEATAAGYKNVDSVGATGSVSAKDGSYSYSLNADGTVTNASDGSSVQMQCNRAYGNMLYGGAMETAKGTKIYSNATVGLQQLASGACTPMEFSSPFFAWGAVAKAAFGGLFGASAVSSTGGRVFWSGGEVAKGAAAEFASANGMKTLEMTTRGGLMNTVSPFLPRSISNPIWNNLSTNFAKGAVGEANFFTTVAGPRATSIWTTVEQPILQSNSVNIITHTIK